MKRCTLLVLAALLAVGWASQAQAESARANPEAIAQACATAVANMAEARIAGNGQTARQAIEKINRLVEDDKIRPARRHARRAIRRINRQTHHTVKQIRGRRRVVVRLLRRFGAADLVERIKAFCAEKIDEVRASKTRAVAAIRDALPSDDDGGDTPQ